MEGAGRPGRRQKQKRSTAREKLTKRDAVAQKSRSENYMYSRCSIAKRDERMPSSVHRGKRFVSLEPPKRIRLKTKSYR